MPSVFPAIEADTVDQLANLLKIDADELSETVRRFNESVVAGVFDQNVLDDCYTTGLEPPKSHWARPIDSPPYYAYPLRPGITFTYLGVAVNQQTQVIQQNGESCSNVFAAGEIMAGNILGQGYCAGTGMTIGGVFGQDCRGEGSMSELTHIATDAAGENTAEVKRVLEICNACRYCEGFCAAFQALSSRRKVEWSELDYFSNLLSQLHCLLSRLPVFSSPRIQCQCTSGIQQAASRKLPALCLAEYYGIIVPEKWPCGVIDDSPDPGSDHDTWVHAGQSRSIAGTTSVSRRFLPGSQSRIHCCYGQVRSFFLPSSPWRWVYSGSGMLQQVAANFLFPLCGAPRRAWLP